MNAVAELIDVEFPLQFKSGGGCSNVELGVRVDIWRNQCSNDPMFQHRWWVFQCEQWISKTRVDNWRNQSLRVLNFNTLFDLGFTLFCCE